MSDRTTTRRRVLQITAGTLVAGSAMTSVQAADTFVGILADGFDPEPDAGAFLGGVMDGIAMRTGPPPDPDTLADRARNEFTANSDAWLSYGNWLLKKADVTGVGNATIAVDFTITGWRSWARSGQAETTIDATYDEADEEFTAVEWRSESAADPDFEVELQNQAAEAAADELQTFRREFIDAESGDHELPDDEYLNELAGRYWDAVKLGDEGRSAVELLLGEANGGFL